VGVMVIQNDQQSSAYLVDGPQRVRPAAYVLGDVPTPTLRPFREGVETAFLPGHDVASPYRSFRREKGESISAVRGLMFGVLFAVPAWALIIWGAISIGSALS
jgi:hypothetical protein